MVMKFNFDDRPFIVIWEVTRACSLACRHCRAEASLRRHPLELSTEESLHFIDQVARCRPALFVMTGGDPIRRQNLEMLVRWVRDYDTRSDEFSRTAHEALFARFAGEKRRLA